jgi:hypothetical protein
MIWDFINTCIGLSAFSFAFYQYWRVRPRLKVSVDKVLVKNIARLRITLSNHGLSDMIVNALYFVSKDGLSITMTGGDYDLTKKLPAILKPLQEQKIIWLEIDAFIKFQKKNPDDYMVIIYDGSSFDFIEMELALFILGISKSYTPKKFFKKHREQIDIKKAILNSKELRP